MACQFLGSIAPLSFAHRFPLALKVSAGQSHFPSPAQDYEQEDLDLLRKLMPNRPATFMFQVEGESMINIGIYPGSLLVVDKSLAPANGSIVVVDVDGEWMVKRLLRRGGLVQLLSENADYPAITFREGQQLVVFGVVTYVIHHPE